MVTAYPQTAVQSQIEIRENAVPLNVQGSLVGAPGNPRIRYSQPKVVSQSLLNAQETVEHIPAPVIANTVTVIE